MNTQSEAQLENQLIKQLSSMGYESVAIDTEEDLIANLKIQLQKHNNTTFSDNEFNKILNHLKKGSIYEKAKTLRDRYALPKDDGTSFWVEFLDSEHWCQNLFQVTHQITINGRYTNRYDVTLLINGLPLVQIELKRTGLALKEAFNQIKRYHKHSYGANSALFYYIQLFVISNGANTKYFANQKKTEFKQTSFWSDEENEKITHLEDFTRLFLERCHISKMICKYTILNENKELMILRPYQYYAVAKIIDRVQNSEKNGYIWHTTGSGKTLTSFKAAQILINLPKVHKVIFVVDRKDLDNQSAKEFNSFKKGSVDSTENTKILVNQFLDQHTNTKGERVESNLIVTTIQKLNNAIAKKHYLEQMVNETKDRTYSSLYDAIENIEKQILTKVYHF
jgi:type I restriction enzyme R subunit